MKYVILLITLLLSFNLTAQDSGLFYDTSRDGEGIVLTRDGQWVNFFLFTYGAYGCDGKQLPSVSPVISLDEQMCEYNGQRWFFATDKYDKDSEEVEGFLYITQGVNYPAGVPDGADPFVNIVGDPIAIGIYILKRHDKGWRLLVVPFGQFLEPDDELFAPIFNFTTPLMWAND